MATVTEAKGCEMGRSSRQLEDSPNSALRVSGRSGTRWVGVLQNGMELASTWGLGWVGGDVEGDQQRPMEKGPMECTVGFLLRFFDQFLDIFRL